MGVLRMAGLRLQVEAVLLALLLQQEGQEVTVARWESGQLRLLWETQRAMGGLS